MKDIVIGDSYDGHASPGKHPLPLRIGLHRPVVNAAIDLHGKGRLRAVEIEDEPMKWSLPQELLPAQPAVAQSFPKAPFCRGRFATKPTRPCHQRLPTGRGAGPPGMLLRHVAVPL